MSGLFWASKNTDPKRQFRFYVQLKDGNMIPVWTIKTVTKPKMTVSSTEHSFLNYTFKYPGRVTWDNITITLVDPVDTNVASQVYNILSQSGWKNPTANPQTSSGKGTTIGKLNAVDALKTVVIAQTDENGNVKDRWTLENAWIASADFGGTLDYTSDDFVEVTVEIAFDWAEYKAG
jgi:hypothetical protein